MKSPSRAVAFRSAPDRSSVRLWQRIRSIFRRKALSGEQLERLWQRQQVLNAVAQARHDALMCHLNIGPR